MKTHAHRTVIRFSNKTASVTYLAIQKSSKIVKCVDMYSANRVFNSNVTLFSSYSFFLFPKEAKHFYQRFHRKEVAYSERRQPTERPSDLTNSMVFFVGRKRNQTFLLTYRELRLANIVCIGTVIVCIGKKIQNRVDFRAPLTKLWKTKLDFPSLLLDTNFFHELLSKFCYLDRY